VAYAVSADLLAQVPDVDVDHVRAGVVVVAPDVRQQLLPAQHLPWVTHERVEHRELAGADLDGATFDRETTRAGVEHHVPDTQDRGLS
jgi:hypothetical protein